MTSSEATALPEGAIEGLAGRVGSVLRGDRQGRGCRVGVACAEFNGGITWRLLEGALAGLEDCGVDRADVRVAWVPGAFELPLAARAFAVVGAVAVDAVVCLGAVVRGDTGHYDFVAGQCAAGLQRVQLDTGVPVVFGVLTTDTVAQAVERSAPGEQNKGWEAAVTAVEMHRLLHFRDDLRMLRIVLPKGSLERATLELFAAADLAVTRSSDVDYRASIADPRVAEVRILRPQEIPVYVADGLFDLGITGRDWVEERGVDVVSLGELPYSKATANPIRVVLAVAEGSPYRSVADLAGQRVRVSTEYPELTRRALQGVDAEISVSYGATEAKVPDIADCVVEITETGRALRAAGLRVIDTLLLSHTELIANPAAAADPAKRHAMAQILTLLQGTLEAREKVLVKLNVPADRLEAVVGVLPALRAPTVSELSGGGGFALETVVPKAEINTLIPALKDQGATDILELALAKIVH